jgi:antitoxin HicB
MQRANFDDYPHVIRPLTVEEGGGYMITFPDLPGCVSDGESESEAIENGRDAFEAWMETQRLAGRAAPVPGSHPKLPPA